MRLLLDERYSLETAISVDEAQHRVARIVRPLVDFRSLLAGQSDADWSFEGRVSMNSFDIHSVGKLGRRFRFDPRIHGRFWPAGGKTRIDIRIRPSTHAAPLFSAGILLSGTGTIGALVRARSTPAGTWGAVVAASALAALVVLLVREFRTEARMQFKFLTRLFDDGTAVPPRTEAKAGKQPGAPKPAPAPAPAPATEPPTTGPPPPRRRVPLGPHHRW